MVPICTPKWFPNRPKEYLIKNIYTKGFINKKGRVIKSGGKNMKKHPCSILDMIFIWLGGFATGVIFILGVICIVFL